MVSFTYLQSFHRCMKWNISCHINKQRCHNYLWFWPPKCDFLSHASKQQMRGTVSHTKNVRMLQSFTGGQGQAISQWTRHPSPKVRWRGQAGLPEAGHCVCMLSHFSHIWLFATLWTIVSQTPLSFGFSRQEYWSGLPFLPAGIFPTQG